MPGRGAERLGVAVAVVQAPMAGVHGVALAVAAARAGGLGSLPCAMLGPDAIRAQVAEFRAAVATPIGLNFFCHTSPPDDDPALGRWRLRLGGYAAELGVATGAAGAARRPFDEVACALVEELRPEVVSFHFGLPRADLLARVRAAGCVVVGSATVVREARWLEDHGADVIVAQGSEAGGHRGTFLATDAAAQPGLMALVPQVVDAVRVPVLAAGGIADARGVAAALALGASGVQVGTAYLRCPETTLGAAHRAALAAATDEDTVLTNVFTGRPARGVINRLVRDLGPMAPDAPTFPGAAGPTAALRAAAEAQGRVDFTPLWAGQAVAIAGPPGEGAEALTRRLAEPLRR